LAGHGIVASDRIRVYGAIPSSFNGIYTVVTAGGTTLTWSNPGTNASTTTDGFIQKFDSLNASAAAEAPGYITIFACAEGGASLSAEKKAEIKSDIEEKSTAGLVFNIADPIVVNISVDVVIKTRSGFSTLAVADTVEAYVEDLLSPNVWGWENVIRKNQIIARISQLTGVDYVSELTITIDSGYEGYASVDVDGDLTFVYDGSLPSSIATVSEVV
jgi:hypothetical protein